MKIQAPPPSTERQRPAWATIKAIVKLMGKHRWVYLAGLMLGVGDAACQTVVPLFFRHILNGLQDPSIDYVHDVLVPGLLLAVGVTVVFFPIAYWFHCLCNFAVSGFGRDLRVWFFGHIQRLSADFFQRKKVGDISARMTSDIANVEMGLQTTMGLLWGSLVFIQGLVSILLINLTLSGFMLVLLAITFVTARVCLPKIRAMSRSVQDATGRASAVATEYISINLLIKSLAREDFGTHQVRDAATDILKRAQYLWKRLHLFGDSMQVLVRFFSPLALLIVGGWMISVGSLKVGDLVAFWGFWVLMSGSVTMLLQLMTNLFVGLAAGDRLLEYMDEIPLVDDRPDARDLESLEGRIEFRNVLFKYPLASANVVLRSINLTATPGEVIAVAGPSGAGKSTMLQLLLRFYDPVEGQILFDGHDIREFKQRSLRRHIGFVMQESLFFAGSIAENLRLAKENATDDEVREALSNANALEFINELPQGMATEIGERGVRLSGGQKQRLSIARVFLKNPALLLFDEATSSLDSISEKAVQLAMTRLMKGRTTFVVAHRISTIMHADRIVVLENGGIAHEGTHAELVRYSKLYKELSAHQGLA